MNFKRFPFYKQLDAKDCGPASLQIVSKYYGKYFNLDFLRDRCGVNKEGTSIHSLCKAAESIGFKTLPVNCSYKQLHQEVPLPCIVHWRKKHFIVVYKVKKNKVYVSDPEIGLITYTKSEFVNGWLAHLREPNAWKKGKLIALEPTDTFKENKNMSEKTSGYNLLSYLLSHLKPYKSQVLQLFLTMLFITLLQSVFPILTQSIVDIGISTKDINFIQVLLLANIVLIISTSIGNWIRSSINTHIASRIKVSLLSNYIIKLLKLPVSFFENKLIGDILQRVMDYERIEAFMLNSAFTIILAILNLTVFSTILIFYEPKLFYIFFIGSALYILWILLFWNIRKKMDFQYYSLIALNHSHWIEMINNIHDIKNNNYEQGKRWKWEKVQVKLYNVSIKLLGINQTEQLGSNLINTLRDVGLTFLSAYLVINGEMTIGMLVAVQFIIGQLKNPINEIVNFIRSYQMAMISYQRMGEVDRIKQEDDILITEETKYFFPKERSIFTENLSFQFGKGSNIVLKNLALFIPEGKITAIVGSSGSGKSTLIKVLSRIYTPTAGKLFVGGQNIENIVLKDWRDKIGVVTQETRLFKDSILNNIVLGQNEFDEERFLKSIKVANIEYEITQLPLGFNTLLGENGIGLSEGQKQRILIARAVYKNPDYFFLDEATNNLDSKNEKIVMKNLMSEFENRTVIIAAHRLGTIMNADQIVVLDKGRIVELGNHIDLIKNKEGVYYSLFKDQFTR
jgi:ATP-binding cassette subfamily B protein